MAAREIVLLSGMHRSGTSALARVFALAGAILPEPLVPPALGNELGHWEPAEAVAMNDAALKAAGSDVNSLHPLAPEWAQGDGGEAFVEEIRAWLQRVAPEGALTVVKDPRIALLAPFWRTAVERLGARPRFAISWRDPWEVARSLASRQLAHFPDEAWPHARVELMWLRHQLELERASRGARRSFVAYADVLNDWRSVLPRVFADLDLTDPAVDPETAVEIDAFLRPEARRRRRPVEAQATCETAQMAALLQARAGDPEGGAEAFDRVAARFDDAVRLLGDYVGALEARIADDAAGGEAGDARTLEVAMGEAVREAELRAAALVRGSDATSATPDAGAFDALRNRHDGLRAAHSRTLRDLREGQVASQARLDSARDAHGRDLKELLRRSATELADVRDKARAQLAEAEAEISHLKESAREQASRYAGLKRDLRIQTEISEAAAAAASRTKAALEGLRTDMERLDAEIDDHRAGYESVRLEAQASRRELDESRLEHEGTRQRLSASMAEAARLTGQRDDAGAAILALQQEVAAAHAEVAAAQAQAARLGAEATRSGAQARRLEAETVALRASASWRVTRPMRSLTFRLRRLARR